MTYKNETRPEAADPESEAQYDALKERIAEELVACIATGDDPSKDPDALSGFIADAVLDGFVVRKRASPRHR